MSSAVKRVLIYRLGSLGDTVVALPALHLIARVFPNAERRMVTNFPVSVKAPAAASILAENGLVHGYFRYTVGTRSMHDIFKLWWEITSWRPDVLVYLGAARGVQSAVRDARFFRACGIGRQTGVPVTPRMQESLRDPISGTLEPECERLARNIVDLGDARLKDAASWDLLLTDEEKQTAIEALAPAAGRPVLAVSVGTKVQSKDWGRDNWRALLEVLGRTHPEFALALIGAPEEEDASDFAAAGWRAGAGNQGLIINLCGKLTPRESAACFAHARIFLGHDSGPMHLAAAMQTPCVAVFAARNIPRVWYPYGDQHRIVYHHVECAGCELETCTIERKRCLTTITVDEVAGEVNAILLGRQSD